MSQAHIEQFYSKALKDPALVGKMTDGVTGPEDFIRNAVSEGKSQGFDFSYEEADAWIKEQQRMKASGELSNAELESVAGGKGNTVATNLQNQANQQLATYQNSSTSGGDKITAAFKQTGYQIGAYFTSW